MVWDNAPRIIAAQADRVYLGSGDVAYVNGIKDAKPDSLWQIYRPGNPLIDPETQTTLGYEAVFCLGDRQGDQGRRSCNHTDFRRAAGDRQRATG